MFIIEITFTKPLDEVDKHLEDHRSYLKRYYSSNHFITSGRKVPRTGGIILCKASSMDQVNNIITEDPFFKTSVAQYKVIEFTPSLWQPGFENL